jgi:hypothetical protein
MTRKNVSAFRDLTRTTFRYPCNLFPQDLAQVFKICCCCFSPIILLLPVTSPSSSILSLFTFFFLSPISFAFQSITKFTTLFSSLSLSLVQGAGEKQQRRKGVGQPRTFVKISESSRKIMLLSFKLVSSVKTTVRIAVEMLKTNSLPLFLSSYLPTHIPQKAFMVKGRNSRIFCSAASTNLIKETFEICAYDQVFDPLVADTACTQFNTQPLIH